MCISIENWGARNELTLQRAEVQHIARTSLSIIQYRHLANISNKIGDRSIVTASTPKIIEQEFDMCN